MPCKDSEERKAKRRQSYLKNREKELKQAKEYRETNKDKIKEYQKEYRLTPSGKKSSRITDWKRMGVMCDDWDALYQKYIDTHFCELCNCPLTEDTINTSTTRNLDHCHDTGLFRNVLCWNCNIHVIR